MHLIRDYYIRKRTAIGLLMVFLIGCNFWFFQNKVFAAGATLFLSPKTGTFEVGKTFTVRVTLNSGGGVGVNAADGVLKFDTNYLTVVGLSKTGSIFSLWPTEPTFSNKKGEISYAGGNPKAYTGSAGTIFSITFKALKPGTTKVSFSSGSALAADGKGTNVLSGFGDGNYTLTGKEIPGAGEEEEEEVPSGMLPSLPTVSSPTHPDPEQWYSNNTPEFSWKLPSDVTEVSVLLHKYSRATPDYVSEGLLDSVKYEEAVDDGVWYFHIKFKNQYGWGPVAHRKVLIDTKPPASFEIEVQKTDPTDPQPILVFKAEDELSGIDHYEIKIGEGDWINVSAEEIDKAPYKMPAQPPGEHYVEVKAVDKAGNATSASTNVKIEPLTPPSITEIPEKIAKGEILIIKGISLYPNSKIEVFLEREGKTIKGTTNTDTQGLWAYFHKEELEKGTYDVWAKVIDSRGAQSYPSQKYTLMVVSPSIIQTYCWLIILILLVIILVLLAIIFYQRKKCSEKIEKIKKETKDVKEMTNKVFTALRTEIEEQVEFLDKKPYLSEAEKQVRDKLKEALDISEEFIGKEIKDIEKELEEEKK